jgi:carbamoyltransferase
LFLKNSGKVLTVSHHLAHAYSAFAACPFDEGVVMVVDGVGSYRSDTTEACPVADETHPLSRESESYYRFSGAKLEPLKKVWLEPARGFLSDEFVSMSGLGALYSRGSSYVFSDWNKCGELMGLAPYGRPGKFKPVMELKNGTLSIPDWKEDFRQPWLPDSGEN